VQSSASLWKLDVFLKLWAGQTIAQIAAQVSFLAIPLVATITLKATPIQMGLLTAAASLPSLIFGLQAGAIIDRRKRQPIMIGADLLRFVTLAMIPLAWWLDILSIPLLCLIVLVSGVGSLTFDVAYQAFLPSVIERHRLVDGNNKLEFSRTASELAGPGIAGNLIQFLGAPLTLLFNAALYAISALVIWRMRFQEQIDVLDHERDAGIWPRIMAGVRTVWHVGPLRAVVGARFVLNFFNAVLEAVFVLYVVRILDVGPAMLGIIFGVGGLGFLVGAFLPSFANRRLGIGVATAVALVIVGVSDLLVPLAEGSGPLIVPLLIAAQFFFGIGLTLFNVNQVSVRQLMTPAHLQGRASATARFLAMGAIPIGALLGGVLGETIGLRQTLVLAAIGEVAAAAWLWCSPLRAVRDLNDYITPDRAS